MVIGLARSLGFSSNKELQEGLYRCCHTLFDLSREEFSKRWRSRSDSDTKTLRQFVQPTSDALFGEWKERRDPAWLYTHREYKWDSIGVSFCQTHATVGAGIGLLMKGGRSPKRIYDWGAGPGISSLMLAANFPDAVIEYNEINPELIAVFEWFKANAGIKNAVNVQLPSDEYDLLQAYEIAEHLSSEQKGIGDPVSETSRMLEMVRSGGSFLHSSCWSAEQNYVTLGHFLTYNIDGSLHSNVRTNAPFIKAMKKRGWGIIGSGWNSRPNLYARLG